MPGRCPPEPCQLPVVYQFLSQSACSTSGPRTPPWNPPSAFQQLPLGQSRHSSERQGPAHPTLDISVNLWLLANQRTAKRSAPPPRAHVSCGETQGRLLGVAAAAAATATVTAATAASERAWGAVGLRMEPPPPGAANTGAALRTGELGPGGWRAWSVTLRIVPAPARGMWLGWWPAGVRLPTATTTASGPPCGIVPSCHPLKWI